MIVPEKKTHKTAISIENLNLFYDDFQALKSVNLQIFKNQITAFIGPSGCGKSTLLRCMNRMNDVIRGVSTTGSIILDNTDINGTGIDVADLRKKIGMVFQRPNPFPLSVFNNVVYGLRVAGIRNRKTLDEIAERSLRDAGLWEQVKDKRHHQATELPMDQQQRLCVARVLAVQPEIILMDEPCSALDAIATQRIESLITELKKNYTIVIVTHNMQQASRVSDYTGFFYLGELVEFSATRKMFTAPAKQQTEDYIRGRYG